MGGIDCIVFLWREKPWRRTHNRINSGSLQLSTTTGSRDLEKFEDPSGSIEEAQAETSNRSFTISNITSTVSNLLPRRPTPARTESTVAKQRAYERLALEIKDRKNIVRHSVDKMLSERVPDAGIDVDQPEMSQDASHKGKQWWDRQDSDSELQDR
jgi:DnaJ-domain-containing protein 1